MSEQKRVAAIHDISCFGRCSLTVALPILSAAGVETSVIPTAVLSTHTGGFEGFTYRDLTKDIRPISKHWQSLGLKFNALYSGFLGSFEQLEIVSELFDDFKKDDNIIYVDPVMADHGKLYSIFSTEFPKGMAKLCRKADIILPNMTEAAFLLGQTYKPGPYTQDYIEAVLRDLSKMGPKMVVLTGVCTQDHMLGVAVYDSRTDRIGYESSPLVDGFYHGTGDVFASVLLSSLLNGFDLMKSARVAVDFTVESIKRTKDAGTDVRFGVDFENSIPSLIKALNKI
ncbi:MAG: pyridoxamine kinase [Oscillospiraceae bacterium]|nr:pyridoxamine kinase [Oscillospiraceae bacterium]MDD3833266.1 pyridoxamine kinase [Oscillospiraceae bacterium]MDD4546293.1 pyridoxamine kinase [Oscillospiraceae bacterium]